MRRYSVYIAVVYAALCFVGSAYLLGVTNTDGYRENLVSTPSSLTWHGDVLACSNSGKILATIESFEVINRGYEVRTEHIWDGSPNQNFFLTEEQAKRSVEKSAEKAQICETLGE